MSSNQLKAGAIISYLQMALAILVGLIYTPTMIRVLGQSEYGLYNTVVSTISMLSVLSLGFNSSYIRYYSKYKTQNDQESIWRLNGLFMIIFTIIGTVVFICGMFLTNHLHLVFDQGLSASEYVIAKRLMLLLTINLSISFPMSVFPNIISAHERYIFLKVLAAMKTVVAPLVSIPLLLIGCRAVGLVVVTLCVSLVTDALYIFFVLGKLRVRFWFSKFEKGLFLDLLVYTSFIALNLIVDQVNINAGKFLLGRFNGTTAVAIYSVGFSLHQYYMTFSTAISGVFSPRIHRIVNETKDDDALQRIRLTDLFIKVGRIQFLILALIATGLVFFGRDFIAMWAGDGYTQSYYVMLVLIVPSTVPLIQNLGIEIQRAKNKHQFRSVLYIFMAIVNLIFTAVFCPKIGVMAPALGVAISTVIANCFIINIFYHKKCNVDILAFWKSVVRLLLGLLVPIAVGIGLNYWFPQKSLIEFGVCVVIYTAVYGLSMWLLGMNSYEKGLITKVLEKFIKRKKQV